MQMKGMAFTIQLIAHIETIESSPLLETLYQLLEEFEVVLKSPQKLPPQRSCDYQIPLINS